jgi:hypothetical protein
MRIDDKYGRVRPCGPERKASLLDFRYEAEPGAPVEVVSPPREVAEVWTQAVSAVKERARGSGMAPFEAYNYAKKMVEGHYELREDESGEERGMWVLMTYGDDVILTYDDDTGQWSQREGSPSSPGRPISFEEAVQTARRMGLNS